MPCQTETDELMAECDPLNDEIITEIWKWLRRIGVGLALIVGLILLGLKFPII